MEFEELIAEHVRKVTGRKEACTNEESTKNALILPFFDMLGYDIFNPREVMPESTAAPGVNKDRRVDYCIYIKDVPTILVEAKPYGAKLDKYSTQLANYYASCEAALAILTDGVGYRFYADFQKTNTMDEKPFYELNITKLSAADKEMIGSLRKGDFNVNNVTTTSAFNTFFKKQLACPCDDLVRLFLKGAGINTPKQTEALCEQYRPLVKKSLRSCIEDIMKKGNEVAVASFQATEELPIEKASNIVTTDEEMEAFSITKALLESNGCDTSDLIYKDTTGYFAVCIGNPSKWIFRANLNTKTIAKHILLPLEYKEVLAVCGDFKCDDGVVRCAPSRVYFEEISDLNKLADVIVAAYKFYQ